jgi:gamma-glutamyltranspeptidase/glutathione hydrolase
VRSPKKYHYVIEAIRVAFADIGEYLGDEDFVDVPRQGLLSADYVDQRRELIDLNMANPDIKPGDPWEFQPGRPYRTSGHTETSGMSGTSEHTEQQTTHYTTADSEGNVVSHTSTNSLFFGSGLMVPGYGIVLANSQTLFDFEPGGPNELQPNKRPQSTMNPAIILRDGSPFMTTGSPGGAAIVGAVSQVILNALEYEVDLPAAVAEPRVFGSSYPTVTWEDGVPSSALAGLGDRTHEVSDESTDIGNVQALQAEENEYVGVADSRRGGLTLGFPQ